jgi:hypothetical protein
MTTTTASIEDFRRYLVAEHRDKRLNEVLHPPIGVDGAARIAADCHRGLAANTAPAAATAAGPGKFLKIFFYSNFFKYYFFF